MITNCTIPSDKLHVTSLSFAIVLHHAVRTKFIMVPISRAFGFSDNYNSIKFLWSDYTPLLLAAKQPGYIITTIMILSDTKLCDIS